MGRGPSVSRGLWEFWGWIREVKKLLLLRNPKVGMGLERGPARAV